MTFRTMTLLLSLTAFCAFASPTQAEPVLTGSGGILDSLYGWENLIEVQSGADDLWTNTGTVFAWAKGKWAAYDQTFGYFRGEEGNTFRSLFTAEGNGYLDWPYAWASVSKTGEQFRFALDPSGAPRWSSAVDDNSDATDHLRTFEITLGPSAGHYVLAWEDLPLGGDADYQDLIVEVSGARIYSQAGATDAGVPEPTTMAILAAGGVGLFARRKARRRTRVA